VLVEPVLRGLAGRAELVGDFLPGRDLAQGADHFSEAAVDIDPVAPVLIFECLAFGEYCPQVC
jgi:hypothetical protein